MSTLLAQRIVSFASIGQRQVRSCKLSMPSKPQNKQKSSNFKKRVLQIVTTIPSGAVMTYKEVAIKAGKPNAARVVARIMASNYDVNVPCHRVIRSDGTLGGYNRGGENVKGDILLREGFKL